MKPSPPSLAREFTEFAYAAHKDGLSDEVRHFATRQLLDSVGVSLAAIGEDTVRAVAELVSSWESRGSSRHLGGEVGLPPAHAALIGGTLAHALDFDDTHFPSVLHPSATVVPSALAVADEVGANLGTTIDAIALGNELVVRLGMAGYDDELGNSIFFERGFHATSICGAVGSALATGLLRGLDPAELADAIGIASSFGAGLLEANRAGGNVKRMHCGWAALSGTSASDLATYGVTGPPTVIEGRFGFLEAFCGSDANPLRLTEDLGSFRELAAIGFKPYPTNAFTHSVIDAAVELRGSGIGVSDVAGVTIRLPEPVLRTVAEPRDEKAQPSSPYGARFSAPFVFAIALRGTSDMGVVMDDFSVASIRDAELLHLTASTTVESKPELTQAFPGSVPTEVVVKLSDGSSHVVEIDHALGSIGRPLSDEILGMKFRSVTEPLIGSGRSDELSALIMQPTWDDPASHILDRTAIHSGGELSDGRRSRPWPVKQSVR